MIQRIQSVYLFLAAVALAVMFFVPLSLHNFRSLTVPFKLLEKSSGEDITAGMMVKLWPLVGGIIILIVLAIVIIFLYRNRLLQLRLAMLAVLLNIIIIMGVFWTAKVLSGKLDPEAVDLNVEYQLGSYLPLLSLLMFILAHRSVKSDERKVRAADRIR